MSVLGIHSGVRIPVWIVLFSECAPPILPLAVGLLSLQSSEGLAVKLPRSGAQLFWWRRGTQCQWTRCMAMRCHQVWLAEPGVNVIWGWSACECRGQFGSYNCLQRT